MAAADGEKAPARSGAAIRRPPEALHEAIRLVGGLDDRLRGHGRPGYGVHRAGPSHRARVGARLLEGRNRQLDEGGNVHRHPCVGVGLSGLLIIDELWPDLETQ